MKKLFLCLICLIISLPLYGFSLLDSGFGARPSGMGNAFSALGDDSSTLYYNPALLYQIEEHQVSLGYSHLFLNGNHFNLSYIYPKLLMDPDMGISFAASSLMDDGIKTYSPISLASPGDYSAGEDFNFMENLIMLGMGMKVKNIWLMQISAGLGIKYLNRKLQEVNSSGFAFDFGLNFKHRLFNLAIVGKNILATLNSEGAYAGSGDVKEDLPLTLRVGTLLRIQRIIKEIFQPKEERPTVDSPKLGAQYTVNPVVDAEFVFDDEMDINIFTGLEAWLNDDIALRAGYNNIQNISFGGSVDIDFLRVDYSYLIHSELEGTHRITGTYYF